MTEYVINAVLLFAAAWLIRKIPCCQNNRGSFVIGKLADSNDTFIAKREQKIGNITYTITSVFNPEAKGDVIDKISRLIDRDAANISLDEAVNK